MKKIMATYATLNDLDQGNEFSQKICPVCGEILPDIEIQKIPDPDGTGRVELCASCYYRFTKESGLSRHGEPAADWFDQFWIWVQTNGREVPGCSDERRAWHIAEAYSGSMWLEKGDLWLAMVEKASGSETGRNIRYRKTGVVIFSDQRVCEYSSLNAFHSGEPPLNSISLV